MSQVIELWPAGQESPHLRGEAELCPLPLRLLAPGGAVPCHVYLKAAGRGGTEGPFTLAWPRGKAFDAAPADKEAHSFGYIAPDEADQVLDYLLARLGDSAAVRSDQEKAEFLRDALLLWVQRSYTVPAARESGRFGRVKELLKEL